MKGYSLKQMNDWLATANMNSGLDYVSDTKDEGI
jgi:hypothetical protein